MAGPNGFLYQGPYRIRCLGDKCLGLAGLHFRGGPASGTASRGGGRRRRHHCPPEARWRTMQGPPPPCFGGWGPGWEAGGRGQPCPRDQSWRRGSRLAEPRPGDKFRWRCFGRDNHHRTALPRGWFGLMLESKTKGRDKQNPREEEGGGDTINQNSTGGGRRRPQSKQII